MTTFRNAQLPRNDPAASIEPSERYNDLLWRFGEALQAAGLVPDRDIRGGCLWRHVSAPKWNARRPGRFVEVNSGYASLIQRVRRYEHAPGFMDDEGPGKFDPPPKSKWHRYIEASPLVAKGLEGQTALIRNFAWQNREPYWEPFAAQCAELLQLLRCEPYLWPDLNPNTLEPIQ